MTPLSLLTLTGLLASTLAAPTASIPPTPNIVASRDASPNPAAEPGSPGHLNILFRRGEGVHLVNCGNSSSAVVYCPNDGNCNFSPSSDNRCTLTTRGNFQWEGGQKNCTFSTGVRFSWNIQSNAQNQKDYTRVGSGDNGYSKFTIFKDDKHTMYTAGNNTQCRSIYYALP